MSIAWDCVSEYAWDFFKGTLPGQGPMSNHDWTLFSHLRRSAGRLKLTGGILLTRLCLCLYSIEESQINWYHVEVEEGSII